MNYTDVCGFYWLHFQLGLVLLAYKDFWLEDVASTRFFVMNYLAFPNVLEFISQGKIFSYIFFLQRIVKRLKEFCCSFFATRGYVGAACWSFWTVWVQKECWQSKLLQIPRQNLSPFWLTKNLLVMFHVNQIKIFLNVFCSNVREVLNKFVEIRFICLVY